MPQSRTLYTAVFHPPDPPLSLSSSSSTPRTVPITPSPAVLQLSKQHLHLASLPPDYSPPPSPPLVHARVAKLVHRFRSSEFAWDAMRMGCVRRGYSPVPVSRTASEQRSGEDEDIPEAGSSREWPLPETEEEWFALEKRISGERPVKRAVDVRQAGTGSAPNEGPERLRPHADRPGRGVVQERIAKAKETMDSGKGKEKTLPSLGFPVVKRTSSTASAVSRKVGAPTKATARRGTATPSRDATSNAPQRQALPHESSENIPDSYCPPSPPVQSSAFPLYVGDKAPSDALIKAFASDAPSLAQRDEAMTGVVTGRVEGNRPDERTMTPNEGGPKHDEEHVTKIMHMPDDALFLKNRKPADAPAPAPQEHGMPMDLGLGNASGLPVPSTPGAGEQVASLSAFVTPERTKALPTLTALLASSRRSRLRPRPPSRKREHYGSDDGRVCVDEETPSKATVRRRQGDACGHGQQVDPLTRDTKSYLSSPASDSESSRDGECVAGNSPPSPLAAFGPRGPFTQEFVPDFMSTQIPQAGNNYGGTATTVSGGEGILAYNSQFDVEGQVGRVSELLERDVDFDGWLRDIPVDDASQADEHR